jgi:hypothetical protein
LESRLLTDYPTLGWAIKYHVPTSADEMNFDDRQFLVPIYKCDAVYIVIMKSVQQGVSEYAICDMVSKVAGGLRWLYAITTGKKRDLFVADRINRLAVRSPFYRQLLAADPRSSDSLRQKQLGDLGGMIRFVGSYTEDEFTEYPCDGYTIDELDRCNQQHIKLADDRITDSKYKFKRKISTPTVDQYGIHLEWLKSSQGDWQLKCPACNEYQRVIWWNNFVREVDEGKYELRDQAFLEGSVPDIRMHCKFCERPMDRLAPGEYVHAYPDRDIKGFRPHKLISGRTTVAGLWDDFIESILDGTKFQIFCNSDLGEPYYDRGLRLTPEILDELCRDYPVKTLYAGKNPVIMGVDVGSVLNVMIAEVFEGIRKQIWIGTVRDFENLDELMDNFKVWMSVVDLEPEVRGAKAFRDRFPGRVWLCDYPPMTSKKFKIVDTELTEEARLVTVNRTASMDRAHEDWISDPPGIILPRGARNIDGGRFYDQVCAPIRRQSDDKSYFLWDEHGLADHYAHSNNYQRIAMDLLRFARAPGRPIRKITLGSKRESVKSRW